MADVLTKELKELEEIPAIPRPLLYEMIRDAPVRDAELMASFTVMANRCSEGLNVTPADIHKEMSIDFLKVEINELAAKLGRLRTEVDIGASLGRDVSKAQEALGKSYDQYINMTGLEEMYHNPRTTEVATDDIITRYPETLVYVVRLGTLKRKKKIHRLVPVPVVDPLGPLFVAAVKKMKGSFFGISRQRVWQLFTRAGIYAFYQDQGYPVPKNPLRHLRLSEVANVMNEAQRYRYAGWKMKGTQDKYIHLKWDDFVLPLVTLARKAPPLELGRYA